MDQNDPVHLALVPIRADGPPHWRIAEVFLGAEYPGDAKSTAAAPTAPPAVTIRNVRTVDAAGLAEADRSGPRWLIDSTERDYAAVVDSGVILGRCHDVSLTERILLSREAVFGAALSAAAVRARAAGLPAPDDPAPRIPGAQPGLFDSGGPDPDRSTDDPLNVLGAALADQSRRLGTDNACRLLVAAESASGLAAVEMGRRGLPWDVIEHDRLLTEALGPKPPAGSRPERLAGLAEQISAAFGFAVNPDSAVDLRAAFRRAGFDIDSTSRWVLRGIDHPAVAPALQYKELSRLFTANGWNWIADWVSEGRLHSEFLPGGVVSGRWATRGGGGLQIPRAVRGAARALPGHRLVVADAAQLEPRVLAAISGDLALQEVSTGVDLYDGLAADGFGGDRAAAKLAMLGAMYGQTSGEAGRLLATLRSKYPAAMACVENAAAQGEAGGVVRSVLGRTSPPPGGAWREAMAAAAEEDAGAVAGRRARELARSWGRFTRNFVVQASAADWASVWLSSLRRELRAVPGAELVFFQHDELVLHVPTAAAPQVADLARSTADVARDLVFPGSEVDTPVRPLIVGSYAEAK